MPHRTLYSTARWMRRRIRPAIALGLLTALVVTSLGLAVPVSVKKQAAEPYPCQHCSCGCANAEMCWRDCCCYTNEQKIAWARKNGVTPPAYVLAAVEKPASNRRKAASCCCSKRSCCEKAPPESVKVLTWRKRRKNGIPKTRTVALLQVLRCQGLSSNWTLLPPTVMPVLAQLDDAPIGLTERVTFEERLHTGQLPPPELPPPQIDV